MAKRSSSREATKAPASQKKEDDENYEVTELGMSSDEEHEFDDQEVEVMVPPNDDEEDEDEAEEEQEDEEAESDGHGGEDESDGEISDDVEFDEEEGDADEEGEEDDDGDGEGDDAVDDEEFMERMLQQSIDEDKGAAGNEEEEDEEGSDKGPAMEDAYDSQGSDSSDDERPQRNTVGNVPLKWYKDEEHIGYDKDGKRIAKSEKRDALDAFLARTDNKKEWRTVRDEYNDEDVVLTKEEMEMVRRIRRGQFPDVNINPFEEYVDWMKWEDGGKHPLSSAPEPKRRFIPSKSEAKKVVKLVRALRRGWIKMDKPKEEPKTYLLWADDNQIMEKNANGLTYIPAPKPQLPGHDQSYNPSGEYLPTEEEQAAITMLDESERPKFVPQDFDSMRQIPSYDKYVKERFERCLDLYLCPRTRKKRINIDPESLLPKLPKPKDLQPFPTTLCVQYEGHTGPVWSVSVDPSGQWLATGSSDCTVRVWEVRTGRCQRVWRVGYAAKCVQWSPDPSVRLLAVAADTRVLLLNAEVGGPDVREATAKALTLIKRESDKSSDALAVWSSWEGEGAGALSKGGLQLQQKHVVRQLAWHHRGDYFTSVAPMGGPFAVLVHQLSKQATQNPFRKNKGRVLRAIFHPSKPFFFVATQQHVRVYNLAKQTLAKKLTASVSKISSMAIHPQGDNLIVGSNDNKLTWFDMDLSTRPYKTISSHAHSIEGVAFHRSYPLFASCADDATVHVFHGMVYSDLLQNPLIVPVKILRGHAVEDHLGVLDCTFHPTLPWLFTAGADQTVRLFCN
ncbi:Ribosome biogenesis protein 1 [Cymbomonas tetramitiformis]|uniref:Ribosome biogenesis protein BOP1 homolog n=1 Tax=Cymbomonas tetramitiformis TaxID=36881 RepID=A0AAE0LBF2_9CHLO|nr:Ribosome biogenesis protein 1 [Cymbomonas tetramitiformis]|eukprot:gene4161-5139_t